jgi:hypothetical protein
VSVCPETHWAAATCSDGILRLWDASRQALTEVAAVQVGRGGGWAWCSTMCWGFFISNWLAVIKPVVMVYAYSVLTHLSAAHVGCQPAGTHGGGSCTGQVSDIVRGRRSMA